LMVVEAIGRHTTARRSAMPLANVGVRTMRAVTRRGFIGSSVGAAAGAATLGPMGVAPSLGIAAPLAAGAVLALIRPGSRGEISFMVGEREITVDDPALVSRILKATR